MLKHNLAITILYGSLLYMCCKYKDLECRLAIKTMESELYKSLLEKSVNSDKKKKD